MTGDRKWIAEKRPFYNDWWVIKHSKAPRVIARFLTESEARDIAGIDDIKAERDSARAQLGQAVKLLGGLVDDYTPPDGDIERITNFHMGLNNAASFLTSIKEQGDE